MTKNSPRRVTICINGREVEASVIFGFFVFSPPPKPPPMNRHRPYHLMNPLTGIWPAYGDALGYRYVSPNGDGFPVAYSVTHSHTDHCSLITRLTPLLPTPAHLRPASPPHYTCHIPPLISEFSASARLEWHSRCANCCIWQWQKP